jgi:hypothetical protein
VATLSQYPGTNYEVQLNSPDLIEAIQVAQKLDITKQIVDCQNVWKKYFSSEISSARWMEFYNDH